MLTRIASASMVALAATEAKENWLHDHFLPKMSEVFDGKSMKHSAQHILEDIHNAHEKLDLGLKEMKSDLKSKVDQSIEKGKQQLEENGIVQKELARDPDFSKTFAEIVSENGFISEVHPVTTQDGYKLNIFRIKSAETKPGAPVVFMQHGVVDSADCWIMNYADVAPAFQMVRAGYDVWLGNNRGTKYSMGHTTLSTKSKAYWQFSWTELGKYDMPAMLDYTTKTTGVANVTLMAHSQGTSQTFYGITENQAYWKSKVNLFIALAPITRMDHTTNGLLSFFAGAVSLVGNTLYTFHVYDLFGSSTTVLTKAVCGVLPSFCQLMEGFVITHDPSLDDEARFQVYMGHFPAGASVQEFWHYAQIVNSHNMQLFDWGSKALNKEKYGQETPPIVHLNTITDVPIAMFVGKEDDLGDVTDTRWARDSIQSGGDAVVHYEEMEGGHASFLIGKDMTWVNRAKELIAHYNPVQEVVESLY